MLNISLDHIIGHGHFFNNTFLNADSFVRYCKERDLDISVERLEKLEQLGVFLPMIRLRWPKIKIKIKPESNGEGYEDLGMLQPSEEWAGEIKEENGFFFWWDKDAIQSLVEENYLWVPTRERFQSWANYKDKNGRWNTESYYSIFQTLPLYKYIESTTLKIGLETIAGWSKEDAAKWFETWKPHAERITTCFQAKDNAFEITANLSQALSSRYLPYTQSDGATITIPNPDFFDWNTFRRNWSAEDFLKAIGVTVDTITERWQTANIQATYIDPLDGWKEFVSFFRQSQKDRLKGKGLLAQTWRTMESILNLFHEDLTGKRLHEFDRAPEDKELFYGKGIPKNDLKFLEFLANRYGVNPRPKLILAVEGYGEEEQFPRLAEELLPPSFPELRIAVMNIKSVGEFKKLERLIDHYHTLQTIVFVILDRENNAEAKKKALSKAHSIWSPQRTITKEEYIHLWDKSVEFDNFTDEEIAQGMTETCESRRHFSFKEVSICRQKHGSDSDPLSRLYEDQLNYGLPKRKLLKILFDTAIARPEMEIDGNRVRRPIVDVILKVQSLALRNYQPSSFDAWQETQGSAWLGNPLDQTNK